MKVIAVIPARYQSSRLTNKPLIKIGGKPLIQVTFEAALSSKLFDAIYIATDSKKIKSIVNKFGAQCFLTSKKNKNGTERCIELIKILDNQISNNDLIINIQCDEPFIQKSHIQKTINLFSNKHDFIGTIVAPINKTEIADISTVKASINTNKIINDFSRNNIVSSNQNKIYKHIGVYAYTKNTLLKLGKLKCVQRELDESLEQLRWLLNDYIIKCVIIKENLISINTQEDIKKILKNQL